MKKYGLKEQRHYICRKRTLMNFTFLGTGTSQGVPVIACNCRVCCSGDPCDKRLRSSIMIETGGFRIVIDCGPDFRQQMLREKVSTIDAILITHDHKDHLGGLDDVRAFNFFNNRPIDVYSTYGVQRSIRREFSYAFHKEPYPGGPEINLCRIKNKPFYIGDVQIIPIKALHYGTSNFVFGYRINGLTYITDAVKIDEAEKKKIRGSEVIIINALREKKHYSHFNLQEAVALLTELQPRQGFITHISHQMGLHHEVECQLPKFISLAYDGLSGSL